MIYSVKSFWFIYTGVTVPRRSAAFSYSVPPVAHMHRCILGMPRSRRVFVPYHDSCPSGARRALKQTRAVEILFHALWDQPRDLQMLSACCGVWLKSPWEQENEQKAKIIKHENSTRVKTQGGSLHYIPDSITTKHFLGKPRSVCVAVESFMLGDPEC